jgi:hypothetical protein
LKREAALTFGRATRVLRASLCGVALLCFAVSGAVKARVTDVSGQTYNVASMRLAKGSKLTVDCGGVKMTLPLNVVKSIKINPKQISSIEGRLNFGIELLLRDSTAIGDGRVRCHVSADNGIAGKSSKGKISLPFEKLGYIYILGKEDVEKKQPKKKGGAAEQPTGKDSPMEQPETENGASEQAKEGSNETEQPEKEDDEESTREQK